MNNAKIENVTVIVIFSTAEYVLLNMAKATLNIKISAIIHIEYSLYDITLTAIIVHVLTYVKCFLIPSIKYMRTKSSYLCHTTIISPVGRYRCGVIMS